MTRDGRVRRAVEALCVPELSHVVDLVAWAEVDGPGAAVTETAVVVANSSGAIRLGPAEDDVLLWGRDPVANRDPMAFLPYPEELADPSPPNVRNAYPYAAERLRSFFADRRAPELVVVRAPRHFLPEVGGHLGEHGSLDVIQSRAPLVLAGPGLRSHGGVDEHARVVDVAATLAYLGGADEETLADLDGRPLTRLVERGARHVVGLLWDGAGCGDLLSLAEAGGLPAVSRLLARGCALRGGAIAEFPSVTLCNHTSALTGVGPGRHGVIGNVYFDRDTGERVVPNDATTWHRSAEWLRPGVRTVYEMIASARPGTYTASVNEPIDRGAGYSTMALIRDSGSSAGANAFTSQLPDAATSAYATREWVPADPGYAWATQVDDAGLGQALGLWESPAAAPKFLWWNFTLPDAAHHAGGPRSAIAQAAMRDTDRRLGVFLDHVEALGLADETLVLLTADHGFEGTDPQCRGEWGSALRRAGLRVRDEGPGFLYLE